MKPIIQLVQDYLKICQFQKRLDAKTLKAYRIDLRQFCEFLSCHQAELTRETLSDYIMDMNQHFKTRSVKRKIASIKALCHYLEDEGILEENPFRKLSIGMREPIQLPRTIPLRVVESILEAAYAQINRSVGIQEQWAVRDTAVIELLFATGVRVSELCKLDISDVDLVEGAIRIHGKGAKERVLQIGNADVLSILCRYATLVSRSDSTPFFVNRRGNRISEQSVRLILRRYEKVAAGQLHITPHMFRHSFATLLLEEDVDIRYIQKMLGHSSIVTTQIYTHVATAKQKEILSTKHPRNKLLV